MVDKTAYIQKFKQVFEENHNVTISDELAVESFEQLIALFNVIYRPLNKIDSDEK